MSCLDQIFFFPGESMECRKAGLMTVGNNCCKTSDEASNSCGFDNMASKLGLDDMAMLALSLGNTINNLSGLIGTSFSEIAAKAVAETAVTSFMQGGTLGQIGMSIGQAFGDQVGEVALNGLTSWVTSNPVAAADLAAGGLAGSVAEGVGGQMAQAAVSAIANAIGSMITIISIAYTLYQIYNIVQQLAECTPGEMILGCKRAKHVCHKVGNRCKIKIFGMCLQDMEVFCCFNTQLARIIHEQGRPQIGLDWGSGKSPRCRGFYADEFVSLDFGRMDFGEYASELTKQMSSDIGPKVEEAVRKAMDNFGVQ
jgi:hypothetical protein